MRCHYLSDLHLEAQSFDTPLPTGDVLILAGDLCHAGCLDPAKADPYSVKQRERVQRALEAMRRNFERVLLVPGNHEFHDGIFEDTTALLRQQMPGVTVLDNETVEIEGVRFFGATLWTEFRDGSASTLDTVRRRLGDYFFIRKRPAAGERRGPKFQPEDALAAHHIARAALLAAVSASPKPLVVISHHAPSRLGLNPHVGTRDLDIAYASDLDETIASFERVPVWVHGHTHVSRSYRIGRTDVRSNALGFAAKGHGAAGFSVKASFEVAG